jgi:hypothetical protein
VVSLFVLFGLSLSSFGAAAASPKAVTAKTFVGHWFVHGGGLNIEPDSFGIADYADGVAGNDLVLLTLHFSKQSKQMTATANSVGFIDAHSHESAPLPDPTESFAPGDSFRLEVVAPHLIKMEAIQTHYPGVVGNPYWCQTGLAARYRNLCGA